MKERENMKNSDLFNALFNNNETYNQEIKKKIYEKYKSKDFFWIDITSDIYFDIFVLILIEKKYIESDNFYCAEDSSIMIKEKNNIKKNLKTKILTGDAKVVNNTKNIILFSRNYRKIVISIMCKFLEDLNFCDVYKYYTILEEGKNVTYRERYYPNYCIKKVKMEQTISNNCIFNLADEIDFICQRIKKYN